MSLENSGEYVVAATKASPPIGISLASLAGVPLETWVLILTGVYTLLQLFVLIRKLIKGTA